MLRMYEYGSLSRSAPDALIACSDVWSLYSTVQYCRRPRPGSKVRVLVRFRYEQVPYRTLRLFYCLQYGTVRVFTFIPVGYVETLAYLWTRACLGT